SKPLEERRAFAAKARSESQSQTRQKAESIMDVNQQAVEKIMLQHDVTRLIHGHTHRPAIHHFTSGSKPSTRIVLGDWYEQKSLLRVDAEHVLLEDARVKQ
ncbi:MAG: UDP-2,3-diacylglucosamine diphosphatase, partial [Candidatus Angelobacter sp.]